MEDSSHKFRLQNRHFGDYLTVSPNESGTVEVGCGVGVAAYASDQYQTWTYDSSSETLRLAANESLCLSVTQSGVSVHLYMENDPSLIWFLMADQIVWNKKLRLEVNLEIELKAECLRLEDSRKTPKKPKKHQLWNVNYVDRRYFVIRSRLNEKVIDVPGEVSEEGVQLIMYEEKPTFVVPNQLWYEDADGVIISKLNGMTMAFATNKAQNIILVPRDSQDRRQGFRLTENGFIARDLAEGVADIRKASTKNGAELVLYKKTGDNNQRFMKHYVDLQ